MKTHYLTNIIWIILSLVLSSACQARPPVGDTPTPAESTATPAPTAASPTFLYVSGDAVMAQVGADAPRQVATLPDDGPVVATIQQNDRVLLLREQAIQRVQLADGSTSQVAGFATPVIGGQFATVDDSDTIFYAAVVEDADAQFGFATRIGRYHAADDRTSEVLIRDERVELAGAATDGRSLYLLPRGQDPAIGRLLVADTERGAITAELDIRGYGSVSFVPAAQLLVTQDTAPGENGTPDTGVLNLYDLATQPPALRQIRLPNQPNHACKLAWGPEARALYLALCAGDVFAGDTAMSAGLWRLDRETGELMQLAPGMAQQPFLASNQEGLLFWQSGTREALFVQFQTGTTRTITLPAEVVPPAPTDFAPVPLLSPDGQGLLVWDYRAGTATRVALPDGSRTTFALSGDATPVGWWINAKRPGQ